MEDIREFVLVLCGLFIPAPEILFKFFLTYAALLQRAGLRFYMRQMSKETSLV
jgi:hypothetical protein